MGMYRGQMTLSNHVDVDAPLIRPLRVIRDDVFEDGFPSFGLADLELHLGKLWRHVDVVFCFQILQAALKSEPDGKESFSKIS